MAVLKYTVLRLATFFILFAACILLELGMIFALIVGLLGSWAVGYLFFNRLRVEAGEALARRFGGDRRLGASEQQDNAAEDALAEDYHAQREREREQERREGRGTGPGLPEQDGPGEDDASPR
ncbi:DUF4229 domain-containing protein [Nesterenkonia sp. HG001]|uniref:DUF4229 domain-containing protein n=1 Tax=Nesterenkonia sp. HG001 TaxID=2983207 RepID=UPI002AC779D2|nr:DUF4229 domain-containing protein [Nesterenkonia sp. HG001]MDZ5078980.1 DUF4229 domain-containing protein [Nesterenkonia sp. HG001]